MINTEMNLLIDALSITFPMNQIELLDLENGIKNWVSIRNNDFFKFFMSIIDIDPLSFKIDTHVAHYHTMITYGEFLKFKWNGPHNRNGIPTHSLELKGQGCREVELLNLDWDVLLDYVAINNLNCSRIDIAYDMFTPKYFTIQQLLKKSLKAEYFSPMGNFFYIDGFEKGYSTGLSLYYGSRDGNHINIYEKNKERYSKGFDVDTNYWLRFEIRLKNKANDFIKVLVDHGGMYSLPMLYKTTLHQLLSFRINNNVRRERWTVWQPWERFLKNAERGNIKKQAIPKTTLAQKRSHFINSYGKTMFILMCDMNPSQEQLFLNEMYYEHFDKIDKTDLEIKNNDLLSKGKSPYNSLEEFKKHIDNNFFREVPEE